MNVSLVVTKNIVRSIAPAFNGDARLAARAFQRIATVVLNHTDDEAISLAGDIVVEMGPQFKGKVDGACETFERIYAAIVMMKRNQPEAGSPPV